MKVLLNTSVASVALILAWPAAAQQTTPTTATPTATDGQTASSDQTGLADIIISAQRRDESAQRAAVPIDVVSNRELANAGVVTTTNINAAVPSLYVSKGGGVNTSYFIRGVGNFTNNGYSDPAVAFNVDGVYYARPGSTVGTFFDLERIEVLKGPQGTLYGRNATGGAVNVISVKPVPGVFSGYASAGYGNYNAFNIEGAINIPMGPDGALRISGNYIDRDGFNSDGTNDEKGYAVRVQMLANLTSNLTVRVSGDYSHNGGKGVGGTYTGAINLTPGSAATATSPANYTIVPTGFDPRSGLFSPSNATYFAGRVLGGPRINPGPLATPFQNNDFIGASAEFNWKTGIGTFTFIPAFRDSRIDTLYNGPSFRGGLVAEHDEQFSAELRLAGKRVGPVDWLIGGFVFDERIKGKYTISQYTVNTFQSFDSRTKSAAVFGRLTLNVGDHFRIVGGVRYTQDKKRFDGVGQNLIEICTNPAGCIGGPSVPVTTSLAQLGTIITVPTAPGPANSVAFGTNGNRLFYVPITIPGRLNRDKVTYRAAVEYDVGPRSLLYASYETGYRTGGFNFTLGRESYEPEFIKAATIGMKNRFFDNKLQLNIEAFYWKYTNQQVAHFGLDATGGNSYFTENIGKSTIKGIDIDAQFRATPTTLLKGSVQFLDNKLDSFTYNTLRDSAGNAFPPAVGCPATAGTALLPGSTTVSGNVWIVNCSGKPGYNSPKVALNGGIEQTIPVGDYEVVLSVDGRYRSNRSTSFEFLPFQESGSDFTADAAIRFGPTGGKWSITGYVQNLTDRTIPVLSQFAGTTGNVIVTNYAPPRTYGVRARIGF